MLSNRSYPSAVNTGSTDLRRWLHWFLGGVLVASAYVAAGHLALALPGPSPLVAAFWPAIGLALAVLLRWGSRFVPALLVGAASINLLAGAPIWLAALIAVGNVAGPWAAARWMGRAGFNRRLEQRRDLWLLLGAGGVGATLITAANGAIWLALAGNISLLELPATAARWWLGDLLGVLVAGVPLMVASRTGLARALAPGQRLVSAALLVSCVLAVAGTLLMPASLGLASLALLLLPPVLLCSLAMRSGVALPSSAVLGVTCIMLLATASGQGPFALANQWEAGSGLVLLWAYAAMLVALVLGSHAQLAELAQLNERWQLALVGSDLGVADWNLLTGENFNSQRWRALMQNTGDESDNHLVQWLNRIHVDDRDALHSALASASTPVGAGLRREVRLRVGDQWCWFDVHVIVAERNRTGAPMRVVASLADVGARRHAEDRHQLSASVLLHLHEGLVITDAEGKVIDANPTYCRIVGIPREELLGSVPSVLRSGAIDGLPRQQQAPLWAALRSHGHWAGEVIERRRNGEACALRVTVSSVQGADGSARYHVLAVSDVTEQRLQREQLERQAHFDELTRLPNRARLGQLMSEAMAATDRDGYLLAVCYLDLDHFKAINAQHGHDAGDLVLAEVANRLRSALRERGTVWSDAAARLGGDEFVLLLRAGTIDEARSAVERVLRVVAQPIQVRPGSAPEHITASVGATVYPLDASDADTLLRHADHAMYGAKQSGRNGFLFFDPEHSRRHEQRVLAIGRVQEALDRNELLLYYQPKVDLRRGTVLGFEALLRWNHPEHGVMPPAQFLPLIENTGLSARVGDHVLAQALDQLEAWQDQGLDLSVSVNITARHLQESDFSQRLAELLARHQRNLGPRLELEVLETAALTDIGFTSTVLERCARLGVRWALDDFGTGYSTLTYLKRLPVQVLKIDRSFVQHMLTDAQDRAIVEGVISLSRTFDCSVVAEGVESAAQARMLLDMGCEIGQGQGIASPMPAAEVGPWVRAWKGLFALSAMAQDPTPADDDAPATEHTLKPMSGGQGTAPKDTG